MADDFLFAVFANDHPSDFHSQWLGIPIDDKGRGAREIDQIRVSLRRPDKRHGFILERAVLEALKQCYHFEAWRDEQFLVPSNVDHWFNGSIAQGTKLIGPD